MLSKYIRGWLYIVAVLLISRLLFDYPPLWVIGVVFLPAAITLGGILLISWYIYKHYND